MSSSPGFSQLLSFNEHGSGPPLLLVHGLTVTGEMFNPVIDHLATKHRVIVPDLRGHGRSRHLPPPYTAGQLAADLTLLLDHLGIDPTAVLGYSQGGAIAQQLVLDHPRVATASCCLAPTPSTWRHLGRSSKATFCRFSSTPWACSGWRSWSSHGAPSSSATNVPPGSRGSWPTRTAR